MLQNEYRQEMKIHLIADIGITKGYQSTIVGSDKNTITHLFSKYSSNLIFRIISKVIQKLIFRKLVMIHT